MKPPKAKVIAKKWPVQTFLSYVLTFMKKRIAVKKNLLDTQKLTVATARYFFYPAINSDRELHEPNSASQDLIRTVPTVQKGGFEIKFIFNFQGRI